MKFGQKEFTSHLQQAIQEKEKQIEALLERLNNEYEARFNQVHLTFETSFEREGFDPFQPGYSSFISIGISEEGGELIDLHTVPIWVCERSFLGLTVSKNLPGSKVTGELLDESIEEVQVEVYEYAESQLVDIKSEDRT
ncbi:hypothetical protein [Bacillus sp. CGMCC 1.16541]|uniref:hypothetical protein n=1 Tax=Bacillus sp. CGMCC 1.16541 TaxID=2185143 RepID=UPI000D7271E5|nr:hypothetical protein [Bacillus sp. CGMCC 1.16541]